MIVALNRFNIPLTHLVSLHQTSIYSQSWKKAISGTHFQSEDDVIHAVKNFLDSQEKVFFNSTEAYMWGSQFLIQPSYI